MITYPKILQNPSSNSYFMKNTEIYLFKEIEELCELNRYSYCVLSLWRCVLTNIQRRIEYFGIENLKKILKDNDFYDDTHEKRRDRWNHINEYRIIEYAKSLNIIPMYCFNLIKMLYWIKTSVANEEKTIEQDELFSIIILLEQYLFTLSFKEDKRVSIQSNSNKNRRDDNSSQTTAYVMNESEHKINKDKEKQLINKFI